MADDWVNLPNEEALAYLRSLHPTSAVVVEYYSEQAAARAFTVAHIYKLDILQSMLDALDEALQGNLELAEFVSQFEATGLVAGHLETVYRTNIQSAFGRGAWEEGTNTEIAGLLWGWRYHTVGDDRVREEHEELNGEVFATGEGDELFPPWDFNCRCSSEWITNDEAEELGLETAALPEGVRDALGSTEFVSPALRDEEDFQPDLGGYDLGLVSEYLREQ